MTVEAVSCEPFTACGGNLLGEWRLSNVCLSDALKMDLEASANVCNEGSAALTQTKATGTVTFDADSVVYQADLSLDFTAEFPLSCASSAANCADVQQRYAMRDGLTDAACKEVGSSCSCSYRLAHELVKQNGYRVSGFTLSETDASDGSMTEDEYCVTGTTLRIKSPDGIDVYVR